ncbi:hypothetical protein CLAFUW4_10382 [Fulvia fulva]|uniref:Rhodopsin domain-containing protein n=1 Tax=Passalora fulva TaxID=5499 RepID=A0A9Q8LER4_PASFU|nr:uncharacterized protein CLAFUR5_04997 [Fulvia fulva]KAK4615675.1 hypothetical protein CLAFUR4_10386 [Fulvia fulva]KAK4616578.1 hypothetical protein CLAFUR0_10387 [Fulvia fulva]UJO16060.1 hypothetical protein CLAFUR5_04997 [Fulvia fulva]WPV19167.1 hypothetical protein CLAFUW4_10382 [Fulvia fulva]WPV34027.1 hypothetical protein CLAFUW7_10382 [Fulvia fulva]
MALQFLINTSCVIRIYAQCCSHVSALWGDGEVTSCLDPVHQTNYGYFQSAFNSVSDLYLTALPAIIIWRLEIKPMVKAGLSFLLYLSFFAFIASVVKTWQIRILNERGDITGNFVDFVIWAALEIDLVIIVASIPTINRSSQVTNGEVPSTIANCRTGPAVTRKHLRGGMWSR